MSPIQTSPTSTHSGPSADPGPADATARQEDARRVTARMARMMLDEQPDESARLLETAGDEATATLLAELTTDRALSIIRRLTPDRAARVLASLPGTERDALLTALNPNIAAGWLARLDPEQRDACLATIAPPLAQELRELGRYGPDTAGGLMDPRVITFRPDATVRDVIRRLRRFRDRRIYDLFLVDSDGRLIGSVALEDIVLARAATPLQSLVTTEPVRVAATSSRDEVIETFDAHRIASLPVVDFEGRLLGVLRQRELIAVAQREATADAVTMVGASGEERALSSPWFAIRKRLPWLEVNLLTAFLAASVVGLFEGTIARVTALAVLLPVVAGQSGNTGAQALAVTMRGLALREVRTRHWIRVATKESLAAAGNGVAVAATTAAAVFLWSRSVALASVIGISMVISMVMAGLAGALIPMALTALKQDPAQSSSIILTTVTDVAGFFSFLGIATLMMSALEVG